MEISDVTEGSFGIYDNLLQCYEAEFSSLTGKVPDTSGRFAPDTVIGGRVRGILLLLDDSPGGLAAVARENESDYEMCEFYILPVFRRQGRGTCFAHAIWQRYPGHWTVKQIAGAASATEFWRYAIAQYPHCDFREDCHTDPCWGPVTRQRFSVGKPASSRTAR